MVAAFCSPESDCPGMGLGVTASGGGIQILGAESVTYDPDLHEPLKYDCSLQSAQGQYLVGRSIRRIYTAAERAALAGANKFTGLQVFESDTKRTLEWDGTGWVIMSEPWVTSWTPVFTGVTDGSAVKTGRYKRDDGWIDLMARWVFGAGSAITGPVAVTLPINVHSDFSDVMGTVVILDSGTARYTGMTVLQSASSIAAQAIDTSGARGYEASVTSSSPIATPAAGDSISIMCRYPMTTRYS